MAKSDISVAYVRSEEAPRLPAPRSTVGIQGWLRTNLFSSPFYSVVTIVLGAYILWILAGIVQWGLISAVWTGADREACLGEGSGACWPFVIDKLPQWTYGFYPIEQRWRVNVVFLAGAAGLLPMLIPRAPFKFWNALFLIVVFPLLTLILFTGGNFSFSATAYAAVAGLMLVAAAVLPIVLWGLEGGLSRNKLGSVLTGLGLALIVIPLAILILVIVIDLIGVLTGVLGLSPVQNGLFNFGESLLALGESVTLIPGFDWIVAGLVIAGAVLSLAVTARLGGEGGIKTIGGWLGAAVFVLAAMAVLDFDFGLEPVETSKWGGLMVTLVVAITGIVASLPLGILLALGRRSKMPVIKMFSMAFIELWRGVPLITVLFMSSVMLPLFLPVGMNFDKLLRALIGIGLFSAAYMAEVVRGGLQAIPRGQYEGAMALGLSYWQTMRMIILPQALKISIPNIVGNFISLFKDTTLVSIIGIFDLLLIVRTSLKDVKWATPSTDSTGYFTLALMFWVFCFGMSRYSMFMERRLRTGHKR